MAMRKSKSENYFLAAILFLILFLVASAWMLSPYVPPRLREIQNMTSLKDRGTVAQGCVTQMNAYEGWVRLPELVYEFQTDRGSFIGQVDVSEASFQQFRLGHCFDIAYLSEEPTVNAAKTRVDGYDAQAVWEEILYHVLSTLLLIGLGIVFLIVNFFLRRRSLKQKLDLI